MLGAHVVSMVPGGRVGDGRRAVVGEVVVVQEVANDRRRANLRALRCLGLDARGHAIGVQERGEAASGAAGEHKLGRRLQAMVHRPVDNAVDVLDPAEVEHLALRLLRRVGAGHWPRVRAKAREARPVAVPGRTHTVCLRQRSSAACWVLDAGCDRSHGM